MADQSTSKPIGGLTAREQEILIAALGKCLKSGDIQIDYAKLATETGLKDAKSATAVWNPIKKKLFGIASAQSGAGGGTVNKIIKRGTPRKPNEPKEPKTPASTTKKVAKSAVMVEEQEEETDSDEEATANKPRMKVEVNVTNGAESSPPSNVETNNDQEPTTKDSPSDHTMDDTLEPLDKGKGKVSAADKMSSGDMSPPTTPAPTKAKKAATPKAKPAAKTPKTPKTPTGEAANTSPGDATDTPVAVSSSAKKRGRKTKAQKEAEAAVAGGNVAVENDEDEDGGKSVKKARKTAVKKVKKEGGAKDGEAAGAVEDEDMEETPVKQPRKTPVKKAKNKADAENRDGDEADTNHGEDGQTDTLMKKPRKTPVKKGKEETAPASGGSTAGDAVKEEKKKASPKPGATKAKKAATVVLSTEPDTTGKDAEQEAAAKVVEAAELANEVLGGKKIATKTASARDATAALPDWGTPVNGDRASSSKYEATNELAAGTGTTNHGADGDTIVLASEVLESIERDDIEAGDTITVATA